MKKTKIICTIGPASEDPSIIEQLANGGMNAARLNFSHGDHDEHGKRIATIKRIREKLNKPIAIILDTKGPEIRTGAFKGDKVELMEGKPFTMTTREVLGDDTICSVSYKGLPDDLKPGDTILIDDGLVGLRVEKIEGTDIRCTVQNSGMVGSHKGVNVPGVSIKLPALAQKDIDDIAFGIENGIDIIAASFIRKSDDVVAIRKILEDKGADDISIISKIESREGIENIDDIIKFSDGIMVARGDLGVEIPAEEVPLAQKMIIRKCNKAGKPVITATQMLDSMIRNPRPTRAELSDVANAIFDGTDCVMLSGETANGSYPVESLKTMTKIAERVEFALDYNEMMEKRKLIKASSVPDAISYAACTTAAEIGVAAIITATMTGRTAMRVSKYRPSQLIIAVTPNDKVARKLSIVWGVYPILTDRMESADDVIAESVNKAVQSGYIKKGDQVVIAAGIPIGYTGTTNMIKVHTVGDVLVKGVGAGMKSVYGNAAVIYNKDDNVEKGNILVITKQDSKYLDLLDMISGLVAEESGFTSKLAVECIKRGIPIITGASKAASIIRSGSLITLDTIRGLVFGGKADIA
jgi:pyruvate kinase